MKRLVLILLTVLLFFNCSKQNQKETTPPQETTLPKETAPPQDQVMFTQAEKLFYAGRVDSALSVYDSLLFRFPVTEYRTYAERRIDEIRRIKALIKQADKELKSERLDNAFKLYMEARSLNRNVIDSAKVVARINSVKKKIAERERIAMQRFREDITDYYLNVINSIGMSIQFIIAFVDTVVDDATKDKTDSYTKSSRELAAFNMACNVVADRYLDSLSIAYEPRYRAFIERIPSKVSYLKQYIEKGWSLFNEYRSILNNINIAYKIKDMDSMAKCMDRILSYRFELNEVRKYIISFVIKDRIEYDALAE